MSIFNSLQFSVRQRSPFLWKRLSYWISRLAGTRLQKDKSLHFVTINGQQFKRAILCDAYSASELERNLEVFRHAKIFPNVVIRYERELWVEFIEGHPINVVEKPVVEKIADFYSHLYCQDPRLVKTETTLFPDRLDRDLTFLNRVGILTKSVCEELLHRAKVLRPTHCWIGFDYTDPVRKNFVINPVDQSLCAIDVEGLVGDYLIGMGAAKALVRWMSSSQEEFFQILAHKNVPDFHSYYGFIELCFLAQWTKRAFFEKDWKAVNPEHFLRHGRV